MYIEILLLQYVDIYTYILWGLFLQSFETTWEKNVDTL